MQRVTAVIDTVKTKATTTDPVFGCCSLQTATTGIAIFNIVMATIYLLLAIILGLFFTTAGVTVGVEVANTPDEEGKLSNKTTGGAIAVISTIIAIILIAIAVSALLLGVLLYIGAKKRDHAKVRVWFITTLVFTVILWLDALSGLSSFGGFISFLLTILITSYELWVVYAFMHEIDPDNLAARLDREAGAGGEFQGISTNPNEVQFTKNPYETNQAPPAYGQSENYGWDN